MTRSTRKTRERIERLMMAVLDDEATAGEKAELAALRADDAGVDEEFVRLRKLQEVTRMTRILTPSDRHWEGYRRSVAHRLERGLGWLLVSFGAVVLAGWWMWQLITELFSDSGLPFLVKLAVLALGLGLLVLGLSIAREKLFTHRNDPWKEIQR